jgi:hypothetical protein
MDTEIINSIVPHSFHGDVFQNVGESYSYCVTSATAKTFDDMVFAANSCQVKIKMKATSSFNKIAAFPKISGYKFMLECETNVIINE